MRFFFGKPRFILRLRDFTLDFSRIRRLFWNFGFSYDFGIVKGNFEFVLRISFNLSGILIRILNILREFRDFSSVWDLLGFFGTFSGTLGPFCNIRTFFGS